MSKTYDFSSVQSGTFAPIEEGRYTVVIDEAVVKVGETDGIESILLTMTVKDDAYRNRKVWKILKFSDKALFFIKEVLLATGSECATRPCTAEEIAQSVKGKIVSVWIAPETRNGKLVHQVSKFVNPDNVEENDSFEPPTTSNTDSPLFK